MCTAATEQTYGEHQRASDENTSSMAAKHNRKQTPRNGKQKGIDGERTHLNVGCFAGQRALGRRARVVPVARRGDRHRRDTAAWKRTPDSASATSGRQPSAKKMHQTASTRTRCRGRRCRHRAQAGCAMLCATAHASQSATCSAERNSQPSREPQSHPQSIAPNIDFESSRQAHQGYTRRRKYTAQSALASETGSEQGEESAHLVQGFAALGSHFRALDDAQRLQVAVPAQRSGEQTMRSQE